ncbi:hypothetical protein Agabi119p4_9507 [Agaricus bisporus var. burnettii]|uniref:Uncharacterized protein n=1 Tax=Agaricus bisporus var. burnettii TaxID=192524 RepID=A0A8H7EXE7_AGABI|nr:hypothetical protein Agabi119p4_9507 [Agaricus bisporus var. burnettii]
MVSVWHTFTLCHVFNFLFGATSLVDEAPIAKTRLPVCGSMVRNASWVSLFTHLPGTAYVAFIHTSIKIKGFKRFTPLSAHKAFVSLHNNRITQLLILVLHLRENAPSLYGSWIRFCDGRPTLSDCCKSDI